MNTFFYLVKILLNLLFIVLAPYGGKSSSSILSCNSSVMIALGYLLSSVRLTRSYHFSLRCSISCANAFISFHYYSYVSTRDWVSSRFTRSSSPKIHLYCAKSIFIFFCSLSTCNVTLYDGFIYQRSHMLCGDDFRYTDYLCLYILYIAYYITLGLRDNPYNWRSLSKQNKKYCFSFEIYLWT